MEMNSLKRKKKPQAAKKPRTWFPKQISKAEYRERHAAHLERQRRMGIAEADLETSFDGRGELSRMGRA